MTIKKQIVCKAEVGGFKYFKDVFKVSLMKSNMINTERAKNILNYDVMAIHNQNSNKILCCDINVYCHQSHDPM